MGRCAYHPVKFEANWMMGNRAIIHAVPMVTMHAGFCLVLTKHQCSAAKDQQLAICLVLLFLTGFAPQYPILTSVNRYIRSYYMTFSQIMQLFCK